MNIDDIVKLAQQYVELADEGNTARIQQAMGLVSQVFNALDIYENQKLYEVVRQISGFLSNMWKSKNAPQFSQILASDIPALRKMLSYSIEISQGNERSSLMRAFRLMNEVHV